jgi:hypothetical protein
MNIKFKLIFYAFLANLMICGLTSAQITTPPSSNLDEYRIRASDMTINSPSSLSLQGSSTLSLQDDRFDRLGSSLSGGVNFDLQLGEDSFEIFGANDEDDSDCGGLRLSGSVPSFSNELAQINSIINERPNSCEEIFHDDKIDIYSESTSIRNRSEYLENTITAHINTKALRLDYCMCIASRGRLDSPSCEERKKITERVISENLAFRITANIEEMIATSIALKTAAGISDKFKSEIEEVGALSCLPSMINDSFDIYHCKTGGCNSEARKIIGNAIKSSMSKIFEEPTDKVKPEDYIKGVGNIITHGVQTNCQTLPDDYEETYTTTCSAPTLQGDQAQYPRAIHIIKSLHAKIDTCKQESSQKCDLTEEEKKFVRSLPRNPLLFGLRHERKIDGTLVDQEKFDSGDNKTLVGLFSKFYDDKLKETIGKNPKDLKSIKSGVDFLLELNFMGAVTKCTLFTDNLLKKCSELTKGGAVPFEAEEFRDHDFRTLLNLPPHKLKEALKISDRKAEDYYKFLQCEANLKDYSDHHEGRIRDDISWRLMNRCPQTNADGSTSNGKIFRVGELFGEEEEEKEPSEIIAEAFQNAGKGEMLACADGESLPPKILQDLAERSLAFQGKPFQTPISEDSYFEQATQSSTEDRPRPSASVVDYILEEKSESTQEGPVRVSRDISEFDFKGVQLQRGGEDVETSVTEALDDFFDDLDAADPTSKSSSPAPEIIPTGPLLSKSEPVSEQQTESTPSKDLPQEAQPMEDPQAQANTEALNQDQVSQNYNNPNNPNQPQQQQAQTSVAQIENPYEPQRTLNQVANEQLRNIHQTQLMEKRLRESQEQLAKEERALQAARDADPKQDAAATEGAAPESQKIKTLQEQISKLEQQLELEKLKGQSYALEREAIEHAGEDAGEALFPAPQNTAAVVGTNQTSGAGGLSAPISPASSGGGGGSFAIPSGGSTAASLPSSAPATESTTPTTTAGSLNGRSTGTAANSLAGGSRAAASSGQTVVAPIILSADSVNEITSSDNLVASLKEAGAKGETTLVRIGDSNRFMEYVLDTEGNLVLNKEGEPVFRIREKQEDGKFVLVDESQVTEVVEGPPRPKELEKAANDPGRESASSGPPVRDPTRWANLLQLMDTDPRQRGAQPAK